MVNGVTADATVPLADLLIRVSRGERITITDGGKTVAVLAPPPPGEVATETEEERRAKIMASVEKMRELRKGNILGPDLTIREMIEEGRR